MDLEKLHDRFDINRVREILILYGIMGHNVGALKSSYEGSEVCARVDSHERKILQVNISVRRVG